MIELNKVIVGMRLEAWSININLPGNTYSGKWIPAEVLEPPTKHNLVYVRLEHPDGTITEGTRRLNELRPKQ